MPRDIGELLKIMVERKASDLHISAGASIQIRIDEKLVPIDNHILSGEESKALSYSVLSEAQIKKFESD